MSTNKPSRRGDKRPAFAPAADTVAPSIQADAAHSHAELPAVHNRSKAGEPATKLDAHGFDPADYKWVPVRRRARKDGWSQEKQRLFIEHLADTGCVEKAAEAVNMSVQSAYALRRAPGGESFAAAWQAAVQQGALKLADVAFQRALNGVEEPVFDRSGVVIGRKTRYSERLMMFLLRAHLPERYAHAHRGERPAGAADAPETPPVAEALARLEPAIPPEPHKLLAPEELEAELEIADIMDGKLPERYGALPEEPPMPIMPLGEQFERELEAAKRGYHFAENGELVKASPDATTRRNNRRRSGPSGKAARTRKAR